MANKDRVFASHLVRPSGFSFDKNVAAVFDDMLGRSVPLYLEMHRMSVELALNFAQKKTNIYDLGCSTGTLLALLANAINDKTIKFIGVDNSSSMLAKSRAKLKEVKVLKRCRLDQQDINKAVVMDNASVATMILTLQFVRPLHRDKIIRDIYKGLNNRGCLILIEKVLCNDSILNSLFIELYYRFKERSGYTQIEIATKREALENVLIPYRLDENIELLKRNGFKKVDTFFKWYNFCGIIAVK